MTNKPMLSVERELRRAVEQALLAIKRIYQAGYDGIVSAGGSCDQPGVMFENDPTVRELRTLLDKQSYCAEPKVEPAWYEHTLRDDLGHAISTIIADHNGPAFGKPDVDYDKLFSVSIEPLYRNASQPSPVEPESECTSCDGSGEYTDAIGDWRGYCTCPAGVEAEELKGITP